MDTLSALQSTSADDANAVSETTPILNTSGNDSNNGNDNNQKKERQKLNISSSSSSFSLKDTNDNDTNKLQSQSSSSQSNAIVTFLKHNFTIVIIVILLLIIFALAGDSASTKGEAADLVEDQASAMKIQLRPCQIYYSDTSTTSSSGSGHDHFKVIQTTLGDPSTHWGQIPCLVRNEQYHFQLKSFDTKMHTHDKNSDNDNNYQWNWLFSQQSTPQQQQPIIEYGMPSADIQIDFTTIAHPNRQPIMGFGGAFTEASALNYMSLPEDGREAIISLLFGKEGLGYSLGRVHMNSCDFSVESYNFDNVNDDFNLTHFDTNVEHDVMTGMIEMMLRANGKVQSDWDGLTREGGGMKIMASPWSPPAWMKKPTWDDTEGAIHAENMTGSALPNCLREGTGSESRYAASWALYFSKFLTAYKRWGIDLFAVTVQNEPEFPAPWEACAYDPENEAAFIANHLGPVLRRDHPDIKLLIFDHNKDHAVTWASSILNASNPASEFVDGTAIHWYAGGMDRLLDGAQGAPNMHRLMSMLQSQDVKPDHLVLGSEACHCPSTGYAGGDLNVAYARAERYGHTVLSDLAAGSNGWVEWNLVLDALGGPNHLGNMCDSPILAVPYRASGKHNVTILPTFEHADFPFGPVDGDTRTREELNALGYPAEYLDKGIVVQPMFYYMGHISRHVRPGSRAVHAIVDQTKQGSNARTFLQTVNNSTIVGGGINNLARPGVEITLWPCEGSTRQQFTMSDDGKIQVFGHDWLGKPTVSCIGSVVDPSFKGIMLSPCDDSAGIYHIKHTNDSSVKILIENSGEVKSDNCLIAQPLRNNGGAYGPRGGAQVVIGTCDVEAAIWKFDKSIGEISSTYFENGGQPNKESTTPAVCVTTGWPFLQVGAFLGPEHEKNKTIVILNEASEPANYVLRNEKGEVFMTNSIQSHSIQTVVL